MQCFADGDAIRVRAPAKVNLVLEVLRRRADGYHDLEMANVLVSLYDEVVVRRTPEPGITCTVNWPGIPTDERNLAVRAARLVAGDRLHEGGLHLGIRKRIPPGAGLAGGSSDAAASLVAVDRLLGRATPPDRLAAIAAELGSDVPYLLHGGAAVCTGRGEQIAPVAVPYGLPLVIAWPRVELSTAAVYAALTGPLTPQIGRANVLFARLAEGGGWAGVGNVIFNRLEAPAKVLCPAVGETASTLQSLGCQGVVMTGSGSAVIGLVGSPEDAARIEGLVRARHACDAFAVTLVAN